MELLSSSHGRPSSWHGSPQERERELAARARELAKARIIPVDKRAHPNILMMMPFKGARKPSQLASDSAVRYQKVRTAVTCLNINPAA